MNFTKILTFAIIAMFLVTPFAGAKQEVADSVKQDKKIDEKITDKTKESAKEISNKDKDIKGKVTVTDSDTSSYEVSKESDTAIKIKKNEAKREHTKAKVSIPKEELQKIDKDNDKKFGVLHIDDNGETTYNTYTESQLSSGTEFTFSEIIVGGEVGYNEYIFNNVVSGQTLDFPDVSGDYYVTASVNGTIPENNLTKYIIGYEWNTSKTSPTLRMIDVNGNTFNPPAGYFDVHPIWGNMWRCVIDPATNEVTYGTNPRGDGLDLTGANGKQVMVAYPKGYIKFEEVGSLKRWWTSPSPYSGFELDPTFVQRGGDECDVIFQGAYEASGYLDGSTFKLQSATGKQPVTGAVSYPNLPNTGRLYITDAETYGNNVASNDWGITNIYTLSTTRRLVYTEMGTLDSQTKLGKGIVDLASGTNFAGLLTGALSADTNIGTNGTGTGTGTAGQRPIVYRGIENLWGNVWKWIGGIRFYDTVHQIIPPNGTSYPAQVTTSGKYIQSTSVPPNTGIASSGYISNVFTDTPIKYMMLGSTLTGSSSTHLCDYYYIRTASATPTCLLFGGHWYDGLNAGVGYLYSNNGAASSLRTYGARLEFINPNMTGPSTENGNSAIYVGTNGHYTGYNVSSGAEKIVDTDSTCTNLRYVNAMDNNPHTVTVRVYFADGITSYTEAKTATHQNASITHTKLSASETNTIVYELDPLYSGTPVLVSTNNTGDVSVSRNDTHLIIDTDAVAQGQSYSYTVSVADDHDHGFHLGDLMKWVGTGWDFVGVAPDDWDNYIGDEIEVTVS